MSYSSRIDLGPAAKLLVVLFLIVPESVLLLVGPPLIAAACLIGLWPGEVAVLLRGLLLRSLLLCPLGLHGGLLRRLAAACLRG
jgi:hypothetical protein